MLEYKGDSMRWDGMLNSAKFWRHPAKNALCNGIVEAALYPKRNYQQNTCGGGGGARLAIDEMIGAAHSLLNIKRMRRKYNMRMV